MSGSKSEFIYGEGFTGPRPLRDYMKKDFTFRLQISFEIGLINQRLAVEIIIFVRIILHGVFCC